MIGVLGIEMERRLVLFFTLDFNLRRPQDLCGSVSTKICVGSPVNLSMITPPISGTFV